MKHISIDVEDRLLREVLLPLKKIADAYDANNLDDEARKFWVDLFFLYDIMTLLIVKGNTSMLEKLSPEQERMMPHYVDKWLTIGLSTDRVDPVVATPAVIGMYKNGNLEAPEVVFTAGPKAGYAEYVRRGGKADASSFFAGMVYSQHEAGWLGFYDFFLNETDVKNIESVKPLFEVAKTCGWIYCSREIAIVMDRPSVIKMDDQNRLHCENGPAILYPDGFTVYSWHGVRIPREWIQNKDSLTPAMALNWENTEQRRAACEILGWVNILKELDAKVIDEHEAAMIGTLLEVNIPDIGREKFLKVLCGTGREFAIPVPPNMNTALEANAWTFGMDPEELRDIEVRT